ncbi:MAG: PD-(D/E)XK nuclease-like domain-containing protein [Proteobacteria bacterium]|nr:PD-(D/E)XK nuclease-like domain-containing protein [Pseudomonadota bacterium]
MSIKPGIYTDLDMKEYHADPALSRSDIVRLNLSPLLYKEHIDQDKPEYRIGRALHALVLQNIPIVINENDGRSKAGRNFQIDNPDAVTPVMGEMINGMAKRCRPFFQEGQAEVSFFWETDGIICKCRPDWITPTIIYDFKTTRQSLEDFHWDIKKLCYDVQHAWYLRGVEQHIPIDTFRFVVVEKTVPHRVGIFELSNLERAEDLIERGLAIYQTCQVADTWDEPDMKVYRI